MFHLRLFFTALRALQQNFLRSLLATLGVVIGVGAVVAAISILSGTNRQILKQVEALGADQVFVFSGNDRRESRSTRIQSLTLDDAERILKENEDIVLDVAPQFQIPQGGQIKFYERNAAVSVLGTNEAYADMNEYRVAQGRFINRDDVRGGAQVCVLGSKVAEDLFGFKSPVGETVTINGKRFTIIGVMEEKGALGFTEVDSQVLVPITTAMQRMFGSRYVNLIVVQCEEARKLDACIERIKKTLRASHRIRAGDEDDFTVFTQQRMKQLFGQFSTIFAIVLSSIAGISLVVGGIGIMNIMLVSVTERTREIGVRIAVGARRFDILKQFMTEAAFISLLGGGFGAVFGWAVANLIGEYTQVVKTYTSTLTVLLALGMAVLVGIVSGIYPAIRASQLDPVEALRYE